MIGTGVAFTRDPSNGDNTLYGEYLPNAQGEDVVAGIRTPHPIHEMEHDQSFPGVYNQFADIAKRLEEHYQDVQDMEFTIEKGRLFMLFRPVTASAPARRQSKSPWIFPVKEGVIDEKTALQRIPADDLNQLLLPRVSPDAKKTILAKGLAGSPGAAVGQVVFLTAEEAEEKGNAGEKVILVRRETSPEDLRGMVAAQGILTAFGGKTSHAAVVARGMGKCCIVGAGSIRIAKDESGFTIVGTDTVVKKGDWITLDVDSNEGRVLLGKVDTIAPELSGDFATIMEWSDKYRTLGVRTNADTPQDARKAREFGATGIGLCRTEHMFFEGDRIDAVREMIVADTLEDRKKAIALLLPYQKEDFIGIFKAMDGFPVTIRPWTHPSTSFYLTKSLKFANWPERWALLMKSS